MTYKIGGMIASVAIDGEAFDMAKKSRNGRPAGHGAAPQSFGRRLAVLRKARGYSQEDLAAELGTSQRMMAYYEGQAEKPPAHLLPAIARLLGVSTDELLGLKDLKKEAPPRASSRLWRRLRKVEDLPRKDQKHVLDTIDALLARQRLKAAQSG